MATDKDKVKIEINIAGEFIILTVPYEQQDTIRRYEKSINGLYSDWRLKFPKKTPGELMAMLLFQYASYYFELDDRQKRLSDDLRAVDEDLDKLLNPGKETGDRHDDIPF